MEIRRLIRCRSRRWFACLTGGSNADQKAKSGGEPRKETKADGVPAEKTLKRNLVKQGFDFGEIWRHRPELQARHFQRRRAPLWRPRAGASRCVSGDFGAGKKNLGQFSGVAALHLVFGIA
ncbi:hypothetical protein U1Q18_011642 [Sarracenia purpurea var. burkii]